FDSLTAVEIRNRLQAATGLVLPATLAFDYPRAERLAGIVLEQVVGGADAAGPAAPVTLAATGDDPVVLVGMGLRLPGGVGTPEEFWDLVASGRDGIGAIPTDRGWDLEGLYHADPEHAGTFYAREGGFLYGAWVFVAGVFVISPREAGAMEPRPRRLLEAAWASL
ncbi:acyl carrier protein, partial [Streptomyces sp. BE303]|uniref:acyl carrier protein n=1 Tax=Streptomyces sp. BE303 TaxID=3002528 RepID=UPI002E760433